MELTHVNKLFAGFVALIIGIVLITSIATGTLAATDRTIVSAEPFALVTLGCANATGGGIFNDTNAACTFTLAKQPAGGTWQAADTNCGDLASISVENNSASLYTAATSGTDYDFYSGNGSIHMKNTTTTQGADYKSAGDWNTTYITYTYCGDGFLSQDWSRTVLNLVAGFFALAVMGVGIALFYNVYNEARIGA